MLVGGLSVTLGLDRADTNSGMPASDGDARVLHHDGEQTADALRERVLDDRLPAVASAMTCMHGGRIVVVAESTRVSRRRPISGACQWT